MTIHEIESLLGVSRANVRFYEKEGLLSPSRKENGYRDYNDENIRQLKKIIILRKIGVSIPEIKEIFDGKLKIADAVNASAQNLKSQIDELEDSLKLCEEFSRNCVDTDSFDEEYYWNRIKDFEKNGSKYVDICKDYMQFEKDTFSSMWQNVFFHNFGKTEKKFGLIGAVAIVLVICVIRGLMCQFVWKSKSFFEAFIYPFEIFAAASAILAPIYFIAKRKPKAALIITNVIFVICALFLAGLIGLLVVGIILYIFK